METARREGLAVKMALTHEDISGGPNLEERRGLVGFLPVYKVAGAAAEQGASLDECLEIAERMQGNMRTLAVAVRTATHPSTGNLIFELGEDEMEIGMGQHGEAGTGRMQLKSADETAEIMLEMLLGDLAVSAGEKLLVLVNGAGATTLMELLIVFRRVAQILREKEIEAGAQRGWGVHYHSGAGGFSVNDRPHGRGTSPALGCSLQHAVLYQGMTDRISTADLKRMFAEAAQCLREQQQHLCQLDSVAGDGDHGVSMLRTSEQMEAAALDAASQSPRALLKDGGWRVLSVDGGASSALLGAFFTGMADAAGESDLDCEISGRDFRIGPERSAETDAGRDLAIRPWWMRWRRRSSRIRSAAASGAPVADALEQAADAARAGAESTKALVARYGRAKLQGEKTLGHTDAGAASMALLFHGFSHAFAAQQEMDHGGH